MKTTIVILSAVIVLLVAVVTLLFLGGNEDGWLCQNGQWIKHGRPSAPMPQTPCAVQSDTNTNRPEVAPAESGQSELIGGQRDEHGCLAPAGYSWCEAKKKCLRIWEENCPSETAGKGTIEGSLGYPSEFIPEMKVCAENIESKKLVCTEKMIENNKYTYGTGYQLEVAAGTYHVFAMLSDSEKIGANAFENYRAYYSEFVTCGLAYGCPSHAPINVSVKANEAVSKIDPIDWYKK